MRQFLIYFAVVTLLTTTMALGELNVSPGSVYEVNLLVQYPISPDISWAGVYGNLDVVSRELASYYSSAFGYVDIGPADLNDTTASVKLLDPTRKLHVTNLTNWYFAMSKSGDLNFYALKDTCDQNLDALLSDGNFCGDCTPNLTFDQNAYILVDDVNYCARTTTVYDGVPVYVLLAPDGNLVYLSRVGTYTILGDTHNYCLLISLPSTTRFYVYLVPAQRYCGDGICETYETSGCSDCLALSITVTPTYQEANIGQAVQYIANLRNNGFFNLFPTLSVRLVSGDGNTWSASVSPDVLTLVTGAEANVTITAKGEAAGDYKMVLTATYSGVDYNSDTFTLHVPTPPPEEENASASPPAFPSGELNVPETNEVIQLETGGFYIPWARCISNIGLSGPDRVNSKLEENVTINILVQNGGTCEENVDMNIEIHPDEDILIEPESFSVWPGEGRRVAIHVTPKRSGLHYITIIAKGLVTYTHKMELFVSKERATSATGGCESSVLIVSPENIAIVEGEDINTILVKNVGTCREPVIIVLTKRVGGTDVVLDKKEIRLSGGEVYHYVVPKLAAGEYFLTISAGNVEKESKITVTAKPLFSGVGDLFARARLATFAFLLLLLLVLAGYLRYRYLR